MKKTISKELVKAILGVGESLGFGTPEIKTDTLSTGAVYQEISAAGLVEHDFIDYLGQLADRQKEKAYFAEKEKEKSIKIMEEILDSINDGLEEIMREVKKC